MLSGYHRPAPAQTITFGLPASQALPEVMQALSMKKVVLVTNRSLLGQDSPIGIVQAAIGTACVSTFAGIRAHSPRPDVAALARLLRETQADGVIAYGGGSVCDAVKAARLCLANDVMHETDMDRLLPTASLHGPRQPRPDTKPPQLPYVMIPTTLSAGEYTGIAGFTNEIENRKQGYYHPQLAPDTVILDSALTVATPDRLWLGTGMRSVDHIVESWCSINCTPLVEATSLRAASILPLALLASKANPLDLDARQRCLVGAWLASQGMSTGVTMGASHGIGHALGGVTGMPHGETSCVMLPHVLRFNRSVNGSRQTELARAMGSSDGDLASWIADLVQRLGLPGRLRESSVERRDLPRVAEAAMHDRWLLANPRKFRDAQEVQEVLETAW